MTKELALTKGFVALIDCELSRRDRQRSVATGSIEWVTTVNSDGTTSPGHTFNPVIGCMKVSAGCTHCYAEALMDKRYGRAQWGPDTRRVRTSSGNWKKPLQWNANAAEDATSCAGGCILQFTVIKSLAKITKMQGNYRKTIAKLFCKGATYGAINRP